MSVTRTPGHQWPAGARSEIYDYADLDAAAQPVFRIDPGTVHTAAFYAPGVVEKVAALGGPGLRGSYVTPLVHTIQAGFNLPLATLTIDGAAPGDYVLVTPPASLDLALFFDGWVDADSVVRLTAYNFTAANLDIPIDTEFLVLTYSI